ncbi:MurR/RpiR family transcriptional regulator [Glutamicibacter sp.]|uniref:MurR/RpiR family transcriptional regulator n=1 Tax=Glutamicibacter sp. TaxID=1931995 RepID=UPI0028BDE635|nr:MurR/RpiR family transcriptional regulator [Glutamicibacter sp.]
MDDFVTSDTANPSITKLRDRIARFWDELSRAEKSVCRVLSSTSAEHLLYSSAADLGQQSKTSNATVVRTLQSLGYSGLSELKQEIAAPLTSTVSPEVRLQHRINHLGQDLNRIQAEIWAEAQGLLEVGKGANSSDTFASAINILVRSNTIYCYGLGSSAVAADHLAIRLGRTGIPTRRLSTDGFRLADEILHFGAQDTLIIFSPGRKTRDIEALIDQVQLVGGSTILVTDHLHEKLSQNVSVVLRAPLTPTGLTSDSFTAVIVGDILAQGITAVGPDIALRSSHVLNDIRTRLGY